MTLNVVDYHGVHMVGPENFMCAVLRSPEDGKILPIWVSLLDGSNLAAREEGESPHRPGTHDLLADVLSRGAEGVSSLAITSYHEGVFVATIVADGEELDARPSDALILAQILDLPVRVEEDVWNQTAIFLSEEDLAQYLDVEVEQSQLSPEQDLLAGTDVDADFEEMMRSLGFSEGDKPEENPEDDSPQDS